MKVDTFPVKGPVLLTPRVFADSRGFFLESFSQRAFAEATGESLSFVQDNHSRSEGPVVRGLHYQLNPRAQGKLVRCVRGAIYDVAVDIRRASSTFGHFVGVRLDEENKQMLWVPPGFAHGFCTLSDVAEVLYKTTEYYEPTLDRGIHWDDPQIAVPWPLKGDPLVSSKDREAPLLRDAQVFGDTSPPGAVG